MTRLTHLFDRLFDRLIDLFSPRLELAFRLTERDVDPR